ncbi:glycosyltransferase [Paenibacillus sp. GCM10027627]|uniref:glycosyltransferase n=1 Tax=unclassified Paenibacillus TaxID=185978 RepID=UPI00362C96A4
MLPVSRFLEDTRILRNENSYEQPEVSIIMPTYCRGEISLRRAIESVLNQTFSLFEFIIVDDGSKDGTFDILMEYYLIDPRIVIIRHEYNSGLPALRVNEGIIQSRGKYISYQFDDDEYLPDCLETLYNEIIKTEELSVIYGKCKIQKLKSDGESESGVLGEEFSYSKLMNGNFIANNSVLHHKEIFKYSGLYDPHILIRRFSDYDLWLRMSRFSQFKFIDKIVTCVYAGEKYSLGIDIDYNINKLAYTRKYIEQDRYDLLSEANILEYEVDELNVYNNCFSNEQLEYIFRFEIIPFRVKVPYYMHEDELVIANKLLFNKKTIAVLKSEYSTSIDVTIRNFTQRIKDFPYVFFFLSERLTNLINPNEYDYLVLYRTIGELANTALEKSHQHNKPVIYMMDDNMFTFHEIGEQFNYIAPDTKNYKNLLNQVSNSDLVITYNPLITNDCEIHNSHVIQHKTNIPMKYLIAESEIKQRTGRVKYGIFSGPIRKDELKYLWPVLEEFSDRNQDTIEFHFWGIDPSEFGSLSCSVVYKPFNHSYDAYLTQLKENSIDYHISPLVKLDTTTASKSPVKLLEGSVSEAIGIFSDVAPYSELSDEVCIKTKNGHGDWLKALNYSLNLNESERSKYLNNARNYIGESFSTEKQAQQFIASFEAARLIAKLQKKKIAYFLHEAYLGGATLHLLRHSLFVKKYGIEVIFCLPNNQKGIDDFLLLADSHNIPVEYLEYTKYLNIVEPTSSDINNGKSLSKWMLKNNIGLVHSVTYIPSVGIAAKVNNIPHVNTLHQFYQNTTNEKFLIDNRLVDIIHSSSLKYANLWSNNLFVKSYTMACPVSNNYFEYFNNNSSTDRYNENEPVKILLSGTIQDRKNQLSAIKAIKLLRDRGLSIHLDIIGYDNLVVDYADQCLEVILKEGLNDVVKIHGFINEPDRFYNNHSDILLCSSIDESMPQTILQAMAAGLIVVTTEVGGVREIIKDNYTGIIATGTNEHAIAEAIERAIKLKTQEKIDIITNANKTISLVAHHDHICGELFKIYNESFIENKMSNTPVIVNDILSEMRSIVSQRFFDNNKPYMEERIHSFDFEETAIGGPEVINKRSYSLYSKYDYFCGVRVMIGTHGTNCLGSLVGTLFSIDNLNEPLHVVELSLLDFVDNQFVVLKFDPIADSREKRYVLTMQYKRKPFDSGRLSLYEYTNKKTFMDKVLYKLNYKNSYHLYGYNLYSLEGE